MFLPFLSQMLDVYAFYSYLVTRHENIKFTFLTFEKEKDKKLRF